MFKSPRRLVAAIVIAGLAALLITSLASAYSTNFEGYEPGYYGDGLQVPGMLFDGEYGIVVDEEVERFGDLTWLSGQALGPVESSELTVNLDSPQDFVSFGFLAYAPTIVVTGELDGRVVYTTTVTGSEVPREPREIASIAPMLISRAYEGGARLDGRVDTLTITTESYLLLVDNVITGLVSTAKSSGWNANDDSLNATHAARPVAIYASDNGYTIYGIDVNTGSGTLALTITDEMIAAAGVPADEPIVVAEGQNPYNYRPFTLYRLATGEFQLNTFYADGKPYVVKWRVGDSAVTTVDW